MPTRQKISFAGSQGVDLAGSLELPDGEPIACALFAHCFTCGKDIVAASRLARALTARGIAVLRFDFTGLGSSDGDFANTNFSSNVHDLLAAADYLRRRLKAPDLLIGHSLGGTAVLHAASQIAEVSAVVTIGAPADTTHVMKQFQCDIDQIEADGEATVTLAQRQFTIRKQFLDDLRARTDADFARLDAALLVMHSPVDQTVSIQEAEEIYRAARHPKSFVSLDNADHLLSRSIDANYVAETIVAWAGRYLPDSARSAPKARPAVAAGELLVSEHDRIFTQDMYSQSHHWLADEPWSVGGKNRGPDPYAHLLAALGSCTSMTVRMYAERKKWPLKDVSVRLQHRRDHVDDCVACDEQHSQIDVLSRRVAISGELDDAQRARLLEIADRCPVHRTLQGKLVIETVADEFVGSA